jgi:uncharacterized repeat protein (TIGR03803 family)
VNELVRHNTSGRLTTLYSFCSQTDCADGSEPFAGLALDASGSLYGTTYIGGSNGYGTVFKVSPSGAFTTLYSFCSEGGCGDGKNPLAGLVQGTDGNFYGTTEFGGASNAGTVFKITSNGVLTTLHSFDFTDGYSPVAALIQSTDGNLYGTTHYGGVKGFGTLFKISLSGTLTTLHSFCYRAGCPDGAYPVAPLVQDTDGKFYGTTRFGGTNDACSGGCGTVFGLSMGLGPFVETRPIAGKIGAAIKILGTNLTGATSVTFNGTAAVFKVVSSSFITTTVPAGATSGNVQVVTPGGTLRSNVPFRVLP